MNLDRSINKLSERLNILCPDVDNNSPGYWKGRKIIPTSQWLKITNTISKETGKYAVREALQYFPDSYMQYIFQFGIPEHLQEEANKWYLDYLESDGTKKRSRMLQRKNATLIDIVMKMH